MALPGDMTETFNRKAETLNNADNGVAWHGSGHAWWNRHYMGRHAFLLWWCCYLMILYWTVIYWRAGWRWWWGWRRGLRHGEEGPYPPHASICNVYVVALSSPAYLGGGRRGLSISTRYVWCSPIFCFEKIFATLYNSNVTVRLFQNYPPLPLSQTCHACALSLPPHHSLVGTSKNTAHTLLSSVGHFPLPPRRNRDWTQGLAWEAVEGRKAGDRGGGEEAWLSSCLFSVSSHNITISCLLLL